MKFVHLNANEITYSEAELLNLARQRGYIEISPEELADDIRNDAVDVWKIENGPACVLVTTFELIHERKLLNVQYMAGNGARAQKDKLKEAMFQLADEWNCTDVIFTSARELMAEELGSLELARIYKLVRN